MSRQLAAAFHDRGFRGQNGAAHLGPRQPHGSAHLVLLLRLLFAKLLRPQQFVHLRRRDRHLGDAWRSFFLDAFVGSRGIGIDDRARHLAAHVADLALQIADAGFARVVLDQFLQAVVLELESPRRSSPVSFVCLGTRKRLAISIFSSSV